MSEKYAGHGGRNMTSYFSPANRAGVGAVGCLHFQRQLEHQRLLEEH